MTNSDKKYISWLILIDVIIIFIAFLCVGPYSVRTDTDHYVNQINIARGVEKVSDLAPEFQQMYYFKIYKPLYSIPAIWPLGTLSPKNVILLLNIFFLFGFTILSYYFFKLLDFSDKLSFFGAFWISASFPVFKYGLALVTDISGWFFALFSVVLFLKALKKDKLSYIFWASIVGFLGSISKETGVLGLLFCGLYLLMNYKNYGFKNFFKKLAVLCVPFLILQTALYIIMIHLHAASLIAWIKFNYDIFFNDFYKLRYFLTNEFLAFGLVWIFTIVGFWYYIKENFWKDKEKLTFLVSMFLATAPVLLWPVFYYRILFIQFLFVVPLALYGTGKLQTKFKNKKPKILFDSLLFAPAILNIVLFLIIKKY